MTRAGRGDLGSEEARGTEDRPGGGSRVERKGEKRRKRKCRHTGT